FLTLAQTLAQTGFFSPWHCPASVALGRAGFFIWHRLLFWCRAPGPDRDVERLRSLFSCRARAGRAGRLT
ncbi:MAG: hypothetical protein KAU38_04640, partial [Desulfobacterales bacterium]|nr:hypothetical protein [Desulfobacterales bacterium]